MRHPVREGQLVLEPSSAVQSLWLALRRAIGCELPGLGATPSIARSVHERLAPLPARVA